jgi:hypothetical protein
LQAATRHTQNIPADRRTLELLAKDDNKRRARSSSWRGFCGVLYKF